MDEEVLREILGELRTIKKLLAVNILPNETQSNQIDRLSSMGFAPTEIAEVLGTTANTVNVALARIRKARQNKSAD